MYCKNCGKQLDEGKRFCDRCGHSIQKSKHTKKKQNSLTDLNDTQVVAIKGSYQKIYQQNNQQNQNISQKTDRISKETKKIKNTPISKSVKDKLNTHSKVKIKNKMPGGFFALFLIVILLAIACGVFTYIYATKTMDSAWLHKDGAVALNTDATDEPRQESIQAPKQENPQQVEDFGDSPIAKECETYVDPEYNFQIPYPITFVRSTPDTENIKYQMADPLGDGKIYVVVEPTDGKTAFELMKEYADDLAGRIIENKANSAGYHISADRDGEHFYRKCIVNGDIALYFDFYYFTDSEHITDYEQYIKYLAANFQIISN